MRERPLIKKEKMGDGKIFNNSKATMNEKKIV